MSLEQLAINPNNAYETSGVRHNEVVKRVLADYGAQASQLPDPMSKENFIIDASMTVADQLYGGGTGTDPRPGFATIPGYTGLMSQLDVVGQYHQIITGTPGVSPAAAQKIIDILGPLTTFPVPTTDADVAAALNMITNAENQAVQGGEADETFLSFTSVLKHSIVCWWADPNPPGGGVSYFRWDIAVIDGVGFIAGSLAGAAAASTVYHLINDL